VPENIWEAAKEIGKSEADATYDLYRALVRLMGVVQTVSIWLFMSESWQWEWTTNSWK